MFYLFKVENRLIECKSTKRTDAVYGFKVV